MPYFGNKEINIQWLLDLQRWFDVKSEEDDEIYIRPKKDTYTQEEVKQLLKDVILLNPDEFDEWDDGWFRLWWD